MSLKEWKNNEINRKLMKKWGLLKEGGLSAAIDSEPTGVGDEVDYSGLSGTTDSAEMYKSAIRHCEDKLGLKHAARNDCVKETLKKMKAKAAAEKRRHDAHDKCKEWASHPNVVRHYGEEGAAKQRKRCEANPDAFNEGMKYRKDDEELEEGHEHGPECGCPDMEEGMEYRKEDDWGKSPAAFTGTEKEEEEATDDLKRGKALDEDSEGEETYHYGEAEGHDEKELHDLIKRHATKSHIDALKRDMDYDEDHEDRREHGDHFREGKISVREAKEITRRIIARIKKESK